MEGGDEYKKGLWNSEEDRILMDYVKEHGVGKWNRIAKLTGLKRCGKSCRLRWKNYLSPDVKRGDFSEEEDDLIIRLHNLLGNRWSLIAGRVPGRTDNQVKNYWNTHLSKKLMGVNKTKGKTKLYTQPPNPKPSLSLPTEPNDFAYSNSPSNPSDYKVSSDCNQKSEVEKFVQGSSSISAQGFRSSIHLHDEVIMSDDFFDSSFWFAGTRLSLYDPSSFSRPYRDYFADLDWAAL